MPNKDSFAIQYSISSIKTIKEVSFSRNEKHPSTKVRRVDWVFLNSCTYFDESLRRENGLTWPRETLRTALSLSSEASRIFPGARFIYFQSVFSTFVSCLATTKQKLFFLSAQNKFLISGAFSSFRCFAISSTVKHASCSQQENSKLIDFKYSTACSFVRIDRDSSALGVSACAFGDFYYELNDGNNP